MYRRLKYDGSFEERPQGCAGCKSRSACGQIAERRIRANPHVSHAFCAWQKDGGSILTKERYTLQTFSTFAGACAAAQWTTSNDEALAAERAAQNAKRKKKRDSERRRAKKGRPITDAFEFELELEFCVRRHALTSAANAPGAPPWLRNLNLRTINFTCDVWRTEVWLTRKYRGDISARDIANKMVTSNSHDDRPFSSLRSRVVEARTRVSRLEADVDGAAIWPEFIFRDAPEPRSGGHKLNGVYRGRSDQTVTEILDF